MNGPFKKGKLVSLICLNRRHDWNGQCNAKKLVAERVRESVWNWMKRDRYIVKINAGMCAFESEVCSLN